MNFSSVIPRPSIAINRPEKVSAKGNMYKIPIMHQVSEGQTNNYELWTTKKLYKNILMV